MGTLLITLFPMNSVTNYAISSVTEEWITLFIKFIDNVILQVDFMPILHVNSSN